MADNTGGFASESESDDLPMVEAPEILFQVSAFTQ